MLIDSFDISMLGKKIKIIMKGSIVEVVIIAVYPKEPDKAIVGFNSDVLNQLKSHTYITKGRKESNKVSWYQYIDNDSDYHNSCLIYAPIELDFVPDINIIGQICGICKFDAPHQKPNDNDKFVCISCKVLEELGV
jgi:hypothetical protein